MNVFVTGGAKGIGAACAEKFAADGCNVVINYKTSREQAEKLREKIGSEHCLCVQGDCSDEADVNRMFAEAEKAFGTVDVLVNNAGISLIKLFTETTLAEWENVMKNDLTGAFLCSRAVIRNMINAGGGAIVNISSMWGLRGGSCEVAYSAAKAGIIGLTKALAQELSLSHIRVNCVCPGVINTEMVQVLGRETLDELTEMTPLGRLGTPEDIAAAVCWFASEDAGFVTGQVLTADGGFTL